MGPNSRNPKSYLRLITSILISLMFFSILSTPSQAQLEEGMDFYAGILLYAPDFSYDLSPLDKMAEAGDAIIIDESSNLERLGLFGPDIAYGDPELFLYEEYSEYEDEDDSELEFVPGTYYVYPSHYNSEVGVVIYEVKNSIIYPDSNKMEFDTFNDETFGTEEYPEDALENISGLSVNLVMPTEVKEVQVELQIKTLSLDYEIELNESINWFMNELGYIDRGFSVFQSNDRNDSKVVSLTFFKGNAELWLASGNGGQTWNGGTSEGESQIQLVFEGTVIDDSVEREIKKLLEYLNIDPDNWNQANQKKSVYNDWKISPTIDIYDEEFNWITAMYTELKWLAEQSIISGLTDKKIREISDSTIAGYDVFAVQKTPEAGYLRIELGDGGSEGTRQQFSSVLDELLNELKGEQDKPKPKDQIPMVILYTVGGIIVFSALGTFAYTRLKQRRILDNINRKNIFEYIKSNPGVHFKELLRKLDSQPGAMSYHLNVLEKGKFIKSIQAANLRRFYLYGAQSDLKIVLTNIQKRILSIVKSSPGISQSKISEILGKNRMTVNYNIKILDAADLISMEKEGRVSKVFTTGNAEKYLNY